MSLYLQSSVSDTQRVKDLLYECGLTQYYERFADEGFDQLKSVRLNQHHTTNPTPYLCNNPLIFYSSAV